VALLLVLLAGAGGGAWWWARQSLPLLEGQLTMPGLHAPVEVLFDDYDVPSVYAAEGDDAWFAAGVLHARERLWQMEFYRRAARGRLAEVLGSRALPVDRRFLTLDLWRAAEQEWERAAPDVRRALERYAGGVNAVASVEIRRQRPLEMQLLGITPEPWTPVDSMAVGRLMAWRLAENHHSELVRAALAAKLGSEAARQLSGRYPSDAPTILQGPRAASPAASAAAPASSWDAPTSAAVPAASVGKRPESTSAPGEWPAELAWLAPSARRGGSNNWVVAGRKTKSGRPLLANDPHLQIEFPSTWYEMHLVAPDLDVVGVTVPGIPFVALGHNARIAWGMTNTGADVQDLYLERFDLDRKRVYSRGEWVPVEATPVDIPVRGRSAPVKFEVWRTRHGVVFAGTDLDWEAPPAWLSPDGRPTGEQPAYVLRWQLDGDLATAFEAINRATNWESFVAAVNMFAVPSQNIVYADVEGNIGYVMSGKLPIRAGGDGTRPLDGAAGEGEWAGSIDPPSLPRVLNPPAGYITSSNNEVDRGYPNLITRDWAAPFRTTRLHERLSAAEGLDLPAMEALQNDRQSVAAERVLAGVDTAIAEGKRREGGAAAVQVLEQLKAWDKVVNARPVVTLYEAFEDALWRRTFRDEMDEPLFLKFYEWAGAERPAGLFAILGDRQSRWWDDIATVDRRETRDDIFLLAAEDADERFRNDWGSDRARQWDRVHAAPFAHPLGSVALPFRWLFSRGPVPVTGDGTTVMRVSWNRLRPFAGWEAPSWRQIFEVGQWDQSQVVLPAGQSGHPLSPHYFDQNALWREGRYRPQPFSRNAVRTAARHRLLMVPN
jgi:penicillin amidase